MARQAEPMTTRAKVAGAAVGITIIISTVAGLLWAAGFFVDPSKVIDDSLTIGKQKYDELFAAEKKATPAHEYVVERIRTDVAPVARREYVAPVTQIAAPTNVMVSRAGSTSLNVNWNSVSNAHSYWVQCAADPSFTTGVVAGKVDVTGADISGLNPSTTYYVRVMAMGTAGNSQYSVTKSATTDRITLNPPSLSTVATTGSSELYLTWNAVNNANSYRVQYATNPTYTTGVRTVDSWGTGTRIVGLNPNTIYYVRVMAVGTNSNSGYSNTKWAKTDKLKLGAPVYITTEPASSNGIRVTWTAVSSAYSYRVQCATNPEFTSGVRTRDVSGTQVRFDGLNPTTPYYFRVMALGTDSYTNSDYSQRYAWRQLRGYVVHVTQGGQRRPISVANGARISDIPMGKDGQKALRALGL